jgi:alpha-L-fucosidase
MPLLLITLLSVCSPDHAAEMPASVKPVSLQDEQFLRAQYPAYRNADADYRHAGWAALERWMDWKWGLRIHWGLYCMYDGKESWILVRPPKTKDWQMDYYASYQRFNPTNFDADQWMEIMQQAGMKYFSFTSKHHEGFCLWPTKTLQIGFRKKADGTYEEVTNHFSIAETPYQKDIIGELVRAGRAHHLGVSLYYSHIDWHDWDFAWDKRNFWYDPNFTRESDPKRWAGFIQKEREQITELLTWYGPIDMLSLDMGWPSEAREDAYGVARLARKLQPDVLLRNRGIGDYGDYETPEDTIPEDPSHIDRPWQVIYPGGSGFSYKKNDHYKPREWVLESLIDIVAKGGNFQVGFGPDPTGRWPQEMIDRVSYVGDWLKVNGESIFATRPYLRYHEGKDIRFTRSKDRKFVYAISLKWPGKSFKTVLVRARKGSVIRMLGVDQDLKWRQDEKGLVIEIPASVAATKPCQQAYVFKIEAEWPTPEPTMEPAAGVVHVSTALKVVLQPAAGAEVHYTTDGTLPLSTSPLYKEPITISRSAVVKARSFVNGAAPSVIVEGDFRFSQALKCAVPQDLEKGVSWARYNGKWDALPDFSKLRAAETGKSSRITPNLLPAYQPGGLLFTGYLKVPKTAAYTFFLTTGDGDKLIIDGIEVINNDKPVREKTKAGTVLLAAGFHALAIPHYQNRSKPKLSVEYQTQDMAKRAPLAGDLLWRAKRKQQ